ncbi:MAG: N-acetylneuraminate synthase family protein [Alphaproteobacteria bacterium]
MKIFNKDADKDLIVIAEIGVNHQGDVNYAKELIRLAATTGADAVKFQSYTTERYASKENMERFERVKRFQLSEADHIELIKVANEADIIFFSTPVTEDWIPFLNQHTPAFKIASGDITFEPVIRAAATTGKPLIISTGTATIDEIDQAVDWVKDEIGVEKTKENLALMHCICFYPAPIEQANVLSVPFLAERYGLPVGYSNHVIESEACLAAVALGANIIEIHFTDKKTDRDFHDHALSFEPQELKAFIESAGRIKSALGQYTKTVQPCEVDLIPLVRKGVVAVRDLPEGHVITDTDLVYARPATSFTSAERSSLVGRKLKASVAEGHTFKRENVQ